METTPWWKDPKSVVMIIGAIFSGAAAWQASCSNQNTIRNGNLIDHVSTRQDEQIMKTEVIKNDVDALHQKTAVIQSKMPKN